MGKPKRFECIINQTGRYEELPEKYSSNKITTMLPYLTRGIKYTILGDDEGNIQ